MTEVESLHWRLKIVFTNLQASDTTHEQQPKCDHAVNGNYRALLPSSHVYYVAEGVTLSLHI